MGSACNSHHMPKFMNLVPLLITHLSGYAGYFAAESCAYALGDFLKLLSCNPRFGNHTSNQLGKADFYISAKELSTRSNMPLLWCLHMQATKCVKWGAGGKVYAKRSFWLMWCSASPVIHCNKQVAETKCLFILPKRRKRKANMLCLLSLILEITLILHENILDKIHVFFLILAFKLEMKQSEQLTQLSVTRKDVQVFKVFLL